MENVQGLASYFKTFIAEHSPSTSSWIFEYWKEVFLIHIKTVISDILAISIFFYESREDGDISFIGIDDFSKNLFREKAHCHIYDRLSTEI